MGPPPLSNPPSIMPLSDFLNAHKGETAWIFGKGPSFSEFDFNDAGKLRMAINDVAGHVPGVVYCFANDGVQKWHDVYKEGQTLFQPERCLWEYDTTKPGKVACDVVTFKDDHENLLLENPPEKLAECLAIRRGTLGSAIQIAYIMGIRKINLVGIDGGGCHAEGYQWRTRLRGDHGKDYNQIRSAAIDAAMIMGIDLQFYNPKTDTMNTGTVTIRLNKDTLIKGTHYHKGEIASFDPLTAQQMVAYGAAEVYEKKEAPKPEKPVIETAEAKLEEKETATTRSKKSKKGKA